MSTIKRIKRFKHRASFEPESSRFERTFAEEVVDPRIGGRTIVCARDQLVLLAGFVNGRLQEAVLTRFAARLGRFLLCAFLLPRSEAGN